MPVANMKCHAIDSAKLQAGLLASVTKREVKMKSVVVIRGSLNA